MHFFWLGAGEAGKPAVAAAPSGVRTGGIKLNPVSTFRGELQNDVPLTRKTVAVFKEVLGPDKVRERPPILGGEDFSRYGRAGVPIFMYFLGTQAPATVAAAEKEGRSLPSLHSDSFAPVPEPTIKTGVLTMSLAVLNLLGK